MFAELRKVKVESVRVAYPSLKLVSAADSPSLVWEGPLQPIRFTDEFEAILDDLEHDRTVLIMPGDEHEIRHYPGCSLVHSGHILASQIDLPTRRFIVRVTDFNDGRLPETRVIEPEIPPELRVHFLGEGLCAFPPWKYPRDESIVAFIDHCLIWLFKWNIYAQTRPHVWIGSEMQHDLSFLLRNIRPTDACYCGSVQTYEDCHRIANGEKLYGENWIYLEAWLSIRQSKSDRFDRIVNQIQFRSRPRALAGRAS